MTVKWKRKTQDPPIATHVEKPARIGVFVCECGCGVSSILDVEGLVESSKSLPGVIYAGHAPYWCSADGRERLEATIRADGLERIVIAGCSPRTHKQLFQETAAKAGLNPDLLGLINIREGCAWPHEGEHKAATLRANDQIAMEVAHMAALAPRSPVEAQITPRALVIGGGVAGMTAAQELADSGMPVTLIERASILGGRAVNTTSEAAADLVTAVQTHPSITLHLDSLVTQITGSVGAYRVDITQRTSRCQGPASTEQHEPDHTQRTTCGTFGAIIVATGAPDEETARLAQLLRLPQDTKGFLPETRVRLRPGNHVERGIHVCGSAHYPCDTAEAQFQAYSVASRALRHLRKGRVTAHGPVAEVAPEKCNGCGDCLNACPFAAVTMANRPSAPHRFTGLAEGWSPVKAEGLSLSIIDPLLCTGCGNCVSVCPVGAVTVAGWTDAQLEAQMHVALGQYPAQESLPRILIFACEWSGYAASELAGAQRLSYPPNVRLIRLDCSGRLQPGLILKAFEMGAAGILILGCAHKLCHYERGSERAAAAYEQVKALTALLGLPPTRLQLAWTPPDDGPAFAELVTEFVRGVEKARAPARSE